MKTYRTLEVVTINAGKIGLTDEQAAKRIHLLKKKSKGVYEPLGPIMFKAGEEIKLDDVGKVHEAKFEVVEKTAAKK